MIAVPVRQPADRDTEFGLQEAFNNFLSGLFFNHSQFFVFGSQKGDLDTQATKMNFIVVFIHSNRAFNQR